MNKATQSVNESDFSGYTRRWYDEVGGMTLMLLLSEKLPEGVRKAIAGDLCELIDEARRQYRQDSREAISLGADKVMNLYRATRRRRWYDADPETRRAFNQMIALPPRLLAGFADSTLKAGLNWCESQAWISSEEGAGSEQRLPLLEGSLSEASPECRPVYRLSESCGL